MTDYPQLDPRLEGRRSMQMLAWTMVLSFCTGAVIALVLAMWW
jgi:hypothetical protein